MDYDDDDEDVERRCRHTHMQKQPINVKNDIQSKCNGRKRQRAVKLDARRVMCQPESAEWKERERGEHSASYHRVKTRNNKQTHIGTYIDVFNAGTVMAHTVC